MLHMTEKQLFLCHTNDSNHYIKFLSGNFVGNNEVLVLGNRKFMISVLLEEVILISKYIRKQWIFIQNLVLLDSNPAFKDVVQARLDVNDGLKAIHQFTYNLIEPTKRKNIIEAIDSISVSILSLETFEEKVLMKLCYSTKQSVNCPIFEYFHCFLDIQLYILSIRIKCDCSKNVIEENITQIIRNLVLLTRKYFVKEFGIENSSFLCPCVENFWKVLYIILVEKFNSDIFWEKVKAVLEEDDALFSLWLLKDLVNINFPQIDGKIFEQMVMPNLDFLRDKLINSLNTACDISNHLKILYKLNNKIWPNDKKLELLLIIWDYFSKRLNISSKYKSGMYINCIEFTEHLDIILFSPRDCEDEFEIFIGLLNDYLSRQPSHWGKVKCRIFSQLSPFKIGNLDEVGICRVFQLLIGLMQINQEELSKRIASVFGILKEKMVTLTNLNIYISFLFRMVRENRSIEKVTAPLVKVLQEASENQNNFPIIKEFFNGFYHIVKFSKCMQLHQWTLVDQWIIKYLATCYYLDLESALKTLLFSVRKINSEDSWSYWEGPLKKNIYPVLKQIGNNSSCSPLVGELAAEISKHSPDILNDAFGFFTAEAVNYKVTENYLCTILKDYPTEVSLTQIQEKTVVQCWLRICLYSTQNYEEITSNVLKLESIPLCIKNGINNFSDPFVNFIEILGTNKNLFLNSPVLSRFCEMCFENLDQSLIIHLPQIKNEMVILRIYTCLSIALLQCNTLLYDRHKTSSPAIKLISCLLFPTEFVMGKISHPFLDAIRKTWHLYFEGVLKLGQNDDSYVQRTLRDLISKYIPYYSVAESPIYLCLIRESSARVILEKVSTIYFKHPTKESEVNVSKALKLLNEYVKCSTSISLLKIVVRETLFGLCEVYIFHSQRNMALSIIMYIVTCNFYDQLKEEVVKSLLLLTEKHLAFNSKIYFNLVNILAKTIPTEISILKENIVEKIKSIERIRGIGYDDNLRSYLNNLNALLNC